MDYFNSLPLEIQLDIFSRVPAESLITDSKLVCKTWNDLVHHPTLPRLHLYRVNHDDSGKLLGFLASTGYDHTQKFKYFEYNQNNESTTPIGRIRRVNLKTPFYRTNILLNNYGTNIVGSCNGLICLNDGYSSLYVCNPITREQVRLPEIYFGIQKYSPWNSGFGYVPSTDEYKVVGIRKYYNFTLPFAEVHIYTLGSGTGWRNLGEFNINFGLHLPVKGVFANGTLYWIGQDSDMIITFDLAEEKFIEPLSTPPLPPNCYERLNRIVVLNGLLCFVFWIDDRYTRRYYDIWLLENKNNMDIREDLQSSGWSWTKKFKLQDSRLVAVTKSGGALTHDCSNHLNIYDGKTSISKRLVDFKETIREIFPHKNTLISLKQLGEKRIEIMESIEIEKTESCDSPLEHPEEVEVPDKLVSKKIRR